MKGVLPSNLELFRAVVEQGPDALIFADCEGTIRLWNARAEAIFGYAAAEAVGRSLDLIIPENLRAAHWRGYRQAITLGHAKSGGHALATRAAHKLGSKTVCRARVWDHLRSTTRRAGRRRYGARYYAALPC